MKREKNGSLVVVTHFCPIVFINRWLSLDTFFVERKIKHILQMLKIADETFWKILIDISVNLFILNILMHKSNVKTTLNVLCHYILDEILI